MIATDKSPEADAKVKVKVKLDTGLSSLAQLIVLAWWFSGIAIASGGLKFWSLIPPVGMYVAVDRVLTLTNVK